jgi:hypothetical protein
MAMTLFDGATREGLLRRMETVQPDRRPLWGKMNAGQMLAHVSAALAMATGELKTESKKSPLANPLGRWLVIYVMKWPQGTPTAPELLAVQPTEWTVDLARFRELLERAGTHAPEDGEWPRHPAFGRMTGKQWGDLGYRHLDHHLRQFGA